jgi:hypothetical protein
MVRIAVAVTELRINLFILRLQGLGCEYRGDLAFATLQVAQSPPVFPTTTRWMAAIVPE